MPDPRKKIQHLIAALEELRLHVGRKDLAVGKLRVNALLFLNDNANNAPQNCAAGLESGQYEEVLAVLGLKGDLKRWYHDQSYCIEIRESPKSRYESYPSAPIKWRLTDRNGMTLKKPSEKGKFYLLEIDCTCGVPG
jgi:hypothetical protein